ncbi:MAG: hypothetical protein N2C14_08375, partial [Planctomycetales bacterium]
MTALNRKLLRELRASWGLLLCIAAIVAVGISCFVALATCYRNLSGAKEAYYAQCRMADFSIELKKAPTAEVEALADVPGIAAVRARIQSAVTVDLPRSQEPINGVVLSLPSRRGPVINDVVMTQGSYFTNRRAAEVIVNEAFARRHDLHPGGKIHVILNNRRQELFIVGVAISSEFVYLIGKGGLLPDPEHFGVFYLKRDYMEDVFDFQGACNQAVGLLTPETRDRPDAVLDRCELLLESHGVFTTI